ncbi:MAG: transcription termination factor Rho, partial [Gemmataceae bacterium]|nr:transcription termination factor Rho [Gemmataceae bacterium]
MSEATLNKLTTKKRRPTARSAKRCEPQACPAPAPLTLTPLPHGGAEELAGRPETNLGALQRLSVPDLLQLAQDEGLAEIAGLSRQQLILEMVRARSQAGAALRGGGTLELLAEGYGFLRQLEGNYLNSPYDIYVSPAQVRALALRPGVQVEGVVRPPRQREQAFALLQVESVNGQEPERARARVPFEDLTPLHPDARLHLETTKDEIATRVVDLVTPIGKGQRGLIVSPPRAGKTVLLQKMAQSILGNHPECYVIVPEVRPIDWAEKMRHAKS